jgi:hypothetical protein
VGSIRLRRACSELSNGTGSTLGLPRRSGAVAGRITWGDVSGLKANAAAPNGDHLVGGIDDARVRCRRPFVVVAAFTSALLVAIVPAASGVSSGSVSQPQVTIDSSTAGATFATLTVSFTATDGIPRENQAGSTYPGFITLAGPTGMAFSGPPGGDYGIRDGAQAVLHSVPFTVAPDNAGTNVVRVDIPDGFSVVPGDRVEVIAHGVNNPGSPDVAAQLAISTSADPAAVSSPLPISAPPSPKVAGGGCRLAFTGVSAHKIRGGGSLVVRGSVTCSATQRGAVVMATGQRYVPDEWFGGVASSHSQTLRAHHTLNFRLPDTPCFPGRVGHWRIRVGLKVRRHGKRPLVLVTPYDYVTSDCSGGL